MPVFFSTGVGSEQDDFMLGHPAQPGGGNTTLSGNGGDDLIYGDFDFLILSAGSRTSPRDLTGNDFIWSRSEFADIDNDSTPHTTVVRESVTQPEEVYSVEVFSAASQLLTVDLDYGVSPVGTDGSFDVTVIDANGNPVVALFNNDIQDIGSSVPEPFARFLLPTGTFRIVISGPDGTPITTGASYVMHVSLSNQQSTEDSPLVGNDVLFGGAGRDIIYGQGGDDIIVAGPSAFGDLEDTVFGGSGNDQITGGFFTDDLFGGSGNDTFFYNATDFFDNVDGGTGTDTMDFSNYGFGVTINLLTGENNRSSNSGTFDLPIISVEHLIGSQFADTLVGLSSDNNLLIGNGGNDVLLGLGGNDGLAGGAGNDQLFGGAGSDVLNGGGGVDTAHYSGASSRVVVDLASSANNTGQAAGDNLISIESVAATAFNDTLLGNSQANGLFGGAGNDIMFGRGGNDIMFGAAGRDFYNGGAGIDTVNYITTTTGVTVDLQAPGSNAGGAAGEVLISIENLVGTIRDDTLFGNSFANNLSGQAGRDLLFGRGGNDSIFGGDGNDVMFGGTGSDFMDGGDGVDVVSYFQSNGSIVASLINPAANAGDAAGDSYADVETLIGTRFSDFMSGDNETNALLGLGGNDQLFGQGGEDILIGGIGADQLFGGTGTDAASYSTAASGVGVRLDGGQNFGDAAGDTFNSIEKLIGSRFNDVLVGTSGTTLDGGTSGVDTFIGSNTAVTYASSSIALGINLITDQHVNGAAGDKFIGISAFTGSAFSDVLIGGTVQGFGTVRSLDGAAGDDLLFTGEGVETLSGGTGNDTFFGATGAPPPNVVSMFGGEGNDVFRAGNGAENFVGGGGIDTVSYRDATTGVFLNFGGGGPNGAAGDSFSEVEVLVGSNFADQIGVTGATIVRGLGGNDFLLGGTGPAETLDGGTGDDRLGAGDTFDLTDTDTYIFRPFEGNDEVIQFGDDVDTLQLRGFGFGNVNQALARAVDSGNDVFFNFDGDSSILVRNITKAEIADDIDLV